MITDLREGSKDAGRTCVLKFWGESPHKLCCSQTFRNSTEKDREYFQPLTHNNKIKINEFPPKEI